MYKSFNLFYEWYKPTRECRDFLFPFHHKIGLQRLPFWLCTIGYILILRPEYWESNYVPCLYPLNSYSPSTIRRINSPFNSTNSRIRPLTSQIGETSKTNVPIELRFYFSPVKYLVNIWITNILLQDSNDLWKVNLCSDEVVDTPVRFHSSPRPR